MTALLVCVTVVLLFQQALPLLDRIVTVHEARWLPKAPVAPVAVEIPRDIQSQAAEWSDEHARAAHLAAATELYHEHRDWDVVRKALEGYGQ